MLPGMNPRQMQQMMKKMGVNQSEIDAIEVVIRCPDKDIIIESPDVSKVNMMGQETYQIVGEAREVVRNQEEEVVEVTQEDIQTVMDQAGVDEDAAFGALEEAGGDLAEAIMKLLEKKEN